jgi:predicted HD superfamily hydrolase involved in NAD metabolism
MAEYKELIKGMLKPDRYRHSLNVAKSAVLLAKRYGENEDKAYVCGVLHDMMKNTDLKEQQKIMRQAGISLMPIEENNPKLWHAISASAYMKLYLNIEDDHMLNAVRYHTTARPGMTPLEKIIYIADYISDDRDYDGVEKMRQKAFEDIDEAIMEGTRFSITDLASREMQIHPDTINTYNEMCEKLSKVKGI